MFLLQAHGVWNFLGQREDERDDVLRHHRPMHFARVGENDVAVDEFRKYELMNRCRRRVNPPQFPGRRDLLRTNRPGDDNFRIDDFFIHALVVGKMDDAYARELAPQSVGKP